MAADNRISTATRTRGRVIGVAAAALLAASLGATRAEAIPAFSREYKTECTTCHTIFPQRNEFGRAFERNGYVWPGAVAPKKRAPQTEEERKSAEYIALSGIPPVLPLSIQATVGALYNEKAEDNLDQKRWNVELFGGGNFRDTIGFWFNEGLGNQSGGPEGPGQVLAVVRGEKIGVSALNLRVGKFEREISLWSANDHLIGSPVSRSANVGGFAMSDSQAGLELNAFLGPRVTATVGQVDRNNAPSGKPVHSVNDYYGHVGVRFGGADYHGKEPDVDLEKDNLWDFLSVELGAVYYKGSLSNGDGNDHDLDRFGGELGVFYKKFAFMTGVTKGRNNTDLENSTDSTAFSAEADYVLSDKFAFALRYDSLAIDGKDTKTNLTPGVLWAPLQNFKLRLTVNKETYTVNNTTATLTLYMSF
jgi:hypothetical protein